MIRNNWKKLTSGLIGTMLIVTGCTSVGGVDVNKAISNHFTVKSSESNMNLAVEFIPSTSATAEQKAALEKVRNITISIPTIKKQDAQHTSYEGELKTSRGAIPFQLYNNEGKFIAKIDGSNKPIVLNQNEVLSSSLNLGTNSMIDSILGTVLKESESVMPILAAYLTSKTPNLPQTSVDAVSEKVNNETLSLNKLHIELKGNEAGALIASLLSEISKDDKGIMELIGAVYDVVAPTLKQSLIDAGSPSITIDVIGNKNLAVNLISSIVLDYLKTYEAQLSKSIKDGEGKGLLSDAAYLKTDIYLDNDHQVRKSAIEALIPMAPDAANGIGSIKVAVSSEIWNLNKPVTAANPVNVEGDKLVLGGPDNAKLINASKLVHIFDKNSAAYHLLKDDLMITRKRISMIMDQNAGQDPGDSGRPFIKDGSTLVPVRFVVEKLDADVAWNGDLRQVTVKDELSGTEIVLKIDSDIAWVNGKEFKLESNAIITGGSTYIPARFIAEQLGAKVGWDDNTRTVSINRD